MDVVYLDLSKAFGTVSYNIPRQADKVWVREAGSGVDEKLVELLVPESYDEWHKVQQEESH